MKTTALLLGLIGMVVYLLSTDVMAKESGEDLIDILTRIREAKHPHEQAKEKSDKQKKEEHDEMRKNNESKGSLINHQ